MPSKAGWTVIIIVSAILALLTIPCFLIISFLALGWFYTGEVEREMEFNARRERIEQRNRQEHQ
jgi:hypothetical protein